MVRVAVDRGRVLAVGLGVVEAPIKGKLQLTRRPAARGSMSSLVFI
jgi:hypothetical protein